MAKRGKATPADHVYRTIPPLAAYIDRVGAVELNFRRFMVKEFFGHYYKERAIIRLDADGNIFCSHKEYAPTKEEEAAIKEAIAAAEFPEAIGVKTLAALKPFLSGGKIYEFWSLKREHIIMVQERIEHADGTKSYIPWTYFSDHVWRRMEPDGKLPFWKPLTKREKTWIMVHEGAKAAQFADSLVNDPERKKELAAHPWGEALADYEHWGIIGGALALHRADYNELREEKPEDMVYVCDHDPNGEAALQVVSTNWRGSMKGIMFGDRFPYSFDMADKLPENLYARGRYVGPQLKALMKPATWATELIPNPAGVGRPLTKLRMPFRDEWYHSVTPECFVHKAWPDRLMNKQEFNNFVAPFSDTDDTSRLLQKEDSSKALALRYDPSADPGVYGSETTGRYINTHVPSSIKEEEGDIGPFMAFMEHLIPEEHDRTELLRWCATLIARPAVKMHYGVLLISEVQGIGKSTLGEKILAPLMGEPNVSYPSENEIVDSNFNYWLAHKRLAVVHEIYAGHSAKGYNRLKSIITDRYITVSKKYTANYEIENWIHVFACSNSQRAIQLSSDDRRWFVPRVTEEKQSSAWWGDLNRWLIEEGGLGIIKWWAGQWLKDHDPVERGNDAPMSSAKQDIIDEGMSPGMQLVRDTLLRIKEKLGAEAVVLDRDLVALVRDRLHDGKFTDRMEKPITLRRVAKGIGYHVCEKKVNLEGWNATGASIRALVLDPKLVRLTPGEIAKQGYEPAKVSDYAPQIL